MRLFPRIALCVVLLSGSLPAASPHPSPQRLSTIRIEDVMMERAEKIIIPRLEFKNLTPSEALEVIRREILERSPSGNVKFDVEFAPVKAEVPEIPELVIPGYKRDGPPNEDSRGIDTLTVSWTSIPVSKAIRYIAGLAGVQLKVIRGTAFLANLKTRTLPFVFNDPVLCDELGIDPKIADEIRKDLKLYLRKFGITFPLGTELQVLAGGRSLFVRHAEETLNLIQEELEGTIPTPIPGPEVPKQKPDAAAPMRQRAEKLILGEVNLLNVTLLEATDRLTELSRLWDVNEPSPEKRGIQVSVELENSIWVPIPGLEGSTAEHGPFSKRKIRYAAKKVSLLEVIQELAKQVGGVASVEPNSITVKEKPDESQLLTKEYLAPGLSFLPGAPSSASGSPNDFLNASGVPFPPGPTAIYLPSSSKIIARNTEANYEKIAKIVEQSWQDYYASDEWPKEQKRQKRLRELGLYREARLEGVSAE